MHPHPYEARRLPRQLQQQAQEEEQQQPQQEEGQEQDPVAQPDYPVLLQQDGQVWPAAWRTTSMRTPRRDRVMAMLNPPLSQLQPRLSDASAQKEVKDSRIFDLRVVEQPRQCRACGFSELDKRPIDPTPIVQLRVHSSGGVIDTTYVLRSRIA
ncbi:hypothetical protein BCR43DRAFT_481518 [Syncephalastrum racemosum]|uniref:Velvet domain-containing protein n=1 Tax=Syncephalastrum racemosum TaxID=13706 RepID=A0A1X2HS67_SYNRA|nr:hypothetical protein BCR43DRAFT_481518 [Syncephalastrum racemosum]